MAAFKSELFSVDDVLNFYEQHNEADFRIFAGNKPESAYCRFEYLDGNKQIGAENLYNNLLALKQNVQNTNQYLLQIIKKARSVKAGKKAIDYVNVTFQLNNSDVQAIGNNYVAGINESHRLEALYEKMLNQQKQTISELENRLAALEDEEDSEEVEEENSVIGGIMKNPEIQTLLIGALTKFLTPQNSSMSNTARINGISEAMQSESQDEKIQAAIEILKQHDLSLGDDLLKLASIAESNVKQFNMLLSMLRSY